MSADTQSVAEKIDELLENDKNFSTRTGLRFMTAVVREALDVIETAKKDQSSINTRLKSVEDGLNEFFAMRKKEQEHNEAERSKWRWAIITPTLGLVIVEIGRWLLHP